MTIAVPDPPERADRDGLVALPCHHGCTSRMQEQTVYGGRTDIRPPDTFDPGEMAACVTALGEATKLLNGYHFYVEARVTRAAGAYAEAERAVEALEQLVTSTDARSARAELDTAEELFTGLPPAEQRAPGRWARAAAHGIIGMIAIFDVWYFYNAFVNILQLPHTGAWGLRFIAGLPGLAMAAGMVLVGKMLAGPIWRTVDEWRRPPGPADPPATRRAAAGRLCALLAFPVLLLSVFTLWAYLRPIYEADPTAGFPAWAVAALLLALAFVGITAEVLVHSPYAQKVERARRRVGKIEAERDELQDAATAAIARLETCWRGLRNDGHGLISLVRSELGRAWENTILPARLRHLRTGDYAPETLGAVIAGEIVPGGEPREPPQESDPAAALRAEMANVWQFFTGLHQPEPAPGPLATVIENVGDLDPAPLRRRRDHLVHGLDAPFAPDDADALTVSGRSPES